MAEVNIGKATTKTKSVIKVFDLQNPEETEQFNTIYSKIADGEYLSVYIKYGAEKDGIPTKVFIHYIIPAEPTEKEMAMETAHLKELAKQIEEMERVDIKVGDIPVAEF